MGVGKLGLRLIGTHALMSIVEFFLMMPLMGLWENNQIYQWLIGLLLVIFFWLIIYSDVNYTSQNELKRNLFWKPKGFIIGLIASIPALVLFILAIMIQADINYAEIALRIWLSPYTKFFVTFQDKMPYIAIIPIFILPVLTGLSYLDGPRKRKKILDAIKEADAQRTEKSKVDR
ncbi:MAG: hypothetical protein WBI74_02625 [Caldicoprobacterales bacterium]|nr:hypothetical protein [Clostridiales bacterium]